ncbi:ubiquitin carboxyl-terminal hydrolase 12-like [Olea europaea var. sylvestris]|uniref:ubiquitin carboxyl-terminal hydrolase 12-like n=1 Tax=Olea europaea var. sylvestris TaxID=158386 RepID=UPI000C1CFDAE|nr:ubiquitin carboxyl-terminal hydrolase 12-like [Olea europaea var. sylvestris]
MDVKEENGEVAKNQQLKDQNLGKFTWRIENFAGSYSSKLYSEIFEVNGCRWRLLLYPKGNGVEYLSVYLDVPDSHSLPYRWIRAAKFSISLINQKDSKKTIKKGTEHGFNAKTGSDWGYTQFFPIIKLHDKNSGYLVDGVCVIEAEVCLSGPFWGSTDKLSESCVPIDLSESKPVDLDDAESIYVKAKSLLKSTSKASTSSEFCGTMAVPLFQKDAIFAKERFNELILSPLDDLVDPTHETAMTETLSILGGNLSLFCDEQAK